MLGSKAYSVFKRSCVCAFGRFTRYFGLWLLSVFATVLAIHFLGDSAKYRDDCCCFEGVVVPGE